MILPSANHHNTVPSRRPRIGGMRGPFTGDDVMEISGRTQEAKSLWRRHPSTARNSQL
jgi:hypothetical protein